MKPNYKNYIIFLFFLFSAVVQAQEKKLIVGTKVAEPFVIKQNEGSWSGITFDLWNEIDKDLNFDYEVREYDLTGLLNAVENDEIDIAVSPLTLTSEREENFDFTHPYFITSLGIAVRTKNEADIIAVAKSLLSLRFLEIIFVLTLILFAVGLLVWLFERKANEEEFGGKPHHGLGSSFWWAAVTMTTVGYGDKAPKTFGGRMIAFIWMFAGIIMISSITAAITSALTVSQLDSNINSLEDLYDHTVGTVKSSSSEGYLSEKGLDTEIFETPDEAMNALKDNKINAVVYDAPILKYIIKKNEYENIRVLPEQLEPLYYGFALPKESNLKEELNRKILNVIEGKEWRNILRRYLGENK